MKCLILLTQLFLFYSTTWAKTEIVESSNYGPTYIDPINGVARINIQSTLRDPNYADHPPVIECKKLKLVRREHPTSHCIQSLQIADPSETCENLRTAIEGFIDCEEIDVAQMTIRDATKCGNPAGACQTAASATYAVDLPLGGTYREQIRACSPTHELLAVTDSSGKSASVSSMKDLQQCGRNLSGRPVKPDACGTDLRPVNTGNFLWDQQNNDAYKIKVGHTPGFYVGNHAHYYFDYAQKKWCYQFSPFHTLRDSNNQLGRTTASCVIPPVNAHPLEFNRGKTHFTLGIVRLEVDSSGQPVATVGQPMAERDRQGRYNLDTSKPVMRITLSTMNQPADPTVGRRSTFELVNADGTVSSSMTVSPSMVLGSNLNSPGSCRNSTGLYCLTTPTAVSGTQYGDRFCRNNNSSLPLNTATNGLCYSCTGITPGTCDQTTHLIYKPVGTAPATQTADAFNRIPTTYSDISNQLNTCYNGAPTSSPAAGSPSDVAP